MTFEEAIERIEEERGIEDVNPFLAKERDLDIFLALSIIKNLEETYAPKIKMTFEQKDGLMQFLDGSDFGFKTFWICFGSGSSLYKEFSEKELMQAWLHPELIEVVDD